MSDAAPRAATYDDLLGLPEDVRAEVLGGQIVTTPAPLPKHSKAQRALGGFIGGPFDDDDGRGGPDWVCEILSPSTAARDKVQKRNLYAEHGIPHYWIVDVDARTLEAFALEGSRWVLLGSYDDETTAAIPPFEAVELEVGRLFLPRAER